MIGRFAPSPTGSLHVGNLRTALVAWLSAHYQGGEMLVRIEDLDRANSSLDNENSQIRALALLGITHAPVLLRQSERFGQYQMILSELENRGLVYQCFCSRREIRDAVNAPHGPSTDGLYRGTCRELSSKQRRAKEQSGRPPALRLRTNAEQYIVDDQFMGPTLTTVDDLVLQRNDGVPAYNFAVVVDDEFQGITEIVRGDDLLFTTGRQIHLQQLLGYSRPQYLHIPLVHGGDDERLAKRHGALTLENLATLGVTPSEVLKELAKSFGVTCDSPRTARDILPMFDMDKVPRTPWKIPHHWQTDML